MSVTLKQADGHRDLLEVFVLEQPVGYVAKTKAGLPLCVRLALTPAALAELKRHVVEQLGFDVEVITLEPHPARQVIHGLHVPIIHDQKQVMVGGARVAYVGTTRTGMPLCFIRAYPEPFVEMIRTAVELLQGFPIASVQLPPAVVERPKGAAEDDEEEEADDGTDVYADGDDDDDDFAYEPDTYDLDS